MQVSLMISTLLACLIILLSLHALDSLSVSNRSEPRLFTLPLKRIPQPEGIHPHILLQLRINRGIRRLARMTGAEPPSESTLQQHLDTLILSLDVPSGIDRRFNRLGVDNVGDVQLEKRFHQVGVLNPRRKGTRQSVEPAETPTASNSLGLDIENQDTGYLATIQIGRPPKDFELLMDSGSSDLWVRFNESCVEVQDQGGILETTGGSCGNQTSLGPKTSSSFKNSSLPFVLRYGSGAVSGIFVEDDVSIAGHTLNGHIFGVANKETPDFTQAPFSGLMGLGQRGLSVLGVPTPIEALALAGLVNDFIVGYKISRLEDEHNDGEITFGGVDPTKFDPNTVVTLPNVNDQGFWEGKMDAVSVNGNDLEFEDRTAILDTGTTLVLASTGDAQKIHNNILGAKQHSGGRYTIPCNTTTRVVLTFGGIMFPIDPRDFLLQPSEPNGKDCLSGITGGFEGVGPKTTNSTEWLVGDVFLKNAYFSTDVEKNTMSLAKLVPSIA